MNKTLTMNIVETDIEISADGSVKLLSPLPAWLRPGRAHAVMTVTALEDSSARTKRQMPVATPEMLAKRVAAFEGLRELGGLGDMIPDPLTWQREMREESPLHH
jgi:hypothetical protein